MSDDIVIDEHITFEKLISVIASKLEIDETRKKIEVRYIVDGNSPRLLIRNNMSVKLYIEVKKACPNLGCICCVSLPLIKMKDRCCFRVKVM